MICLWGALFFEIWKRNNNTLAYRWDVDNFQAAEPDRPEFIGTRKRIDPITETEDWFFPAVQRVRRYAISALVVAFAVSFIKDIFFRLYLVSALTVN